MGDNRYFKIVEIEVASDCNMACSYCPNSIGQRVEKGQMSFETYNKILDSLEEVSFKGIVSFHFYNEPLLTKNLEEYVIKLKERLPKVFAQIYSNGTLLTQKRFYSLRNAGIDGFNITKHEDIKGKYVFEETFKALPEEEKKRVIYNNYTQIDMSNRAGSLEHITSGATQKTPCLLPSIMMSITLKGNVLPCYEDYFQKLVMGNVNDNSLLEIWSSAKFSDFREDLKKPGSRAKYSPCDSCNCFNLPTFRYNEG